ncbi:hypothetical protein BJ138DRAFT_1147266 [Hygrophoropsis aurantiaca]|uniref:Uncharacterized protein n=1 Tax=Hygrophoropsis aurantiaca TaxID=72124 RepID=A0ACB8AJ21_9AGAM|nr:hypothetical protein BJ138DRAFT_1147266 [Hygrophoropsis aurantiaca]
MPSLTRLISLFLAFAFSVVGLSVGLNALIKSNQEKNNILKLVQNFLPPGSSVTIDVNDHDIFSVGGVITAVCAVLAVLALVYLVFALLPAGQKSKTLCLQSATLAFGSVWLFAALVPFDIFYATRSAAISATLDGVAVPEALIQQLEGLTGVSPEYKNINYLKLVAILPWFAALFAAVAAGVLYVAAGQVPYEGAPSTIGTEAEKTAESA